MTEQWLSIVEYARTFNISDMTVRRRIKTGKLRAVLKDGKYYIPVSDGQSNASFAPRPDTDVTQAPQPPSQVIVKGHPSADRTNQYQEPVVQQPVPQRTVAVQSQPPMVRREEIKPAPTAMNYNHIPNDLAHSVESERHVSVDAKALLAFCEAAMKKVNDSERRQSEKFRAKFTAIEVQLEKKDMTIQKLQQQVEDLQLLVKILEKKK